MDSIREAKHTLKLSSQQELSGCISKNISTTRKNLTCQGERRYDSPHDFYIAVSNCKSKHGLQLHYRLEVFGYNGKLCSKASTTWHTATVCLIQIISLSVIFVVLNMQQLGLLSLVPVIPTRGHR